MDRSTGRRGLAPVLAAAFALAVTPGIAHASLITADNDAGHLAAAMSAQPDLVRGASWPAYRFDTPNPSAPDAVGVGNRLVGHSMPDDGTSFAVLTTGGVAVADPPNDGIAGVASLTRQNGAFDASSLQVDVTVPEGANCLSVDGVFYSEEYPELALNSSYNDAFIAELDGGAWSAQRTGTIESAANFFFDQNGLPLSIRSGFRATGETGLQYDRSTQLLRASTPV